MSKYVYADNSATTKLSEEALEAMMPFLTERYGNPSSIYSLARPPRKALSEAREVCAGVIGARPDEIVFLSGGTEADNYALFGAARANVKKGRHIITTQIEHHAVLHACKSLEKEGFEVTYVGVDKYGTVKLDELEAAIRPDTTLISVMAANNEVGTIQPLAQIGAIAKKKGVLFHTDAVQAFGHIPLNVDEMGIDLLSTSAHKLHGPRGVGFLYVRKGVKLHTLIYGGGQEKNRRSGTENVAGVAGFAAAAAHAAENMEAEAARLATLRRRLIEGVLKIPATALTGHPENRLPGLASFTIDYIEGESMVLRLDANGIAASTGSACSTGSLDPSHVLLAMGLSHEQAHGSLRLSLGRYSDDSDVDMILEVLPGVVRGLREMSPVTPAGFLK